MVYLGMRDCTRQVNKKYNLLLMQPLYKLCCSYAGQILQGKVHWLIYIFMRSLILLLVILSLSLPRLYRNMGRDHWQYGMIWFNDFWPSPPTENKDIYWQHRETAIMVYLIIWHTNLYPLLVIIRLSIARLFRNMGRNPCSFASMTSDY